MRSLILKRSVTINGHKTSVSLEDAFWSELTEIAISLGMTPSQLITSIDMRRDQINLSSCLRLFVLNFYVNELVADERNLARMSKVASREASAATANKVDGEISWIP
jgi:predicted DNA-binding ribbon-helix-helix protein